MTAPSPERPAEVPRLEDLDYELPEELVAQRPAEPRDGARLLVVERASGRLTDAIVRDLPSWLRPGDALVVNETRVRPARLRVRRVPSGGGVELLFVRREVAGEWWALARPARQARPGAVLECAAAGLRLEVTATGTRGERRLRAREGDVERALEAAGETPLPPYIRRPPDAEDRERYQTVYARVPGAVAAPTAGLHFTRELLATLERHGVERVPILLHVGPGTFRPITASRIEDHVMEEEWMEITPEAATRLARARAGGARVVAVGTTVVRALESAARQASPGAGFAAARGATGIFIHPPHRFLAVDALLTNFHLPRTSLLCLVAAFAGVERIREAYRHAVRGRYRFYSYGDAMLIV